MTLDRWTPSPRRVRGTSAFAAGARRPALFALVCALAVGGFTVTAPPAELSAQPGAYRGVPKRYEPPRGLCRVWYDRTPPHRQPGVTSCSRAQSIARRTGGRVLYGPADRWDRRDCDWRDDRRRDRRRDRRDDCRWDDRRRDCDWRDDRRRDRRDDCGWSSRRSRTRYPATLPDLIWAVVIGDGRRVDAANPWFDGNRYRPFIASRTRDGRPRIVHWRDDRGRTQQRWFDDDDDGRADRVEFLADDIIVDVFRGDDRD